MKQIVIVLHLSTKKEERISVDKWRVIRNQYMITRIEVYKFIDIVNEETEAAPQFKRRSLNMNPRSIPSTKIITPPKKKKCCGG